VFVAEIGEITCFTTAQQLACWAGPTPTYHESDTPRPPRPDHQPRFPDALQGRTAVESVQRLPKTNPVAQLRDQVATRRQTEHVSYALRDHHVRVLHRRTPTAA
jgi:hypothetical protein